MTTMVSTVYCAPPLEGLQDQPTCISRGNPKLPQTGYKACRHLHLAVIMLGLDIFRRYSLSASKF